MPRTRPALHSTLPGMTVETPKASATAVRLLDAAASIYGDDPDDLRFLHVVLAQCGLPYREVRQRDSRTAPSRGC